ncbi:MAG: PAS-domain containing protein [Pseudolabrys sp.]
MAFSAPAAPRDWRYLALIAGACFPAVFLLLHYATPGGGAPLSAFGAALLSALIATSVTLFRIRSLQLHNRRMRVVADHMSQGLYMFNADEQLAVCNSRYMEMYKLPPEVAKPGTKLTAPLEYRIGNATFSRDIESYRQELLGSLGEGSTRSNEVKSDDGRVILITNRPMPDGSWVATHEDATERRGGVTFPSLKPSYRGASARSTRAPQGTETGRRSAHFSPSQN